MKSLCRELGFAVLAWLIPFAASVCIFPLKRSHPPLFESLMGVTLVASTVALGCITCADARAAWSLLRSESA